MEEVSLIDKIMDAVPYVLQALGALVVAATAVVRITPDNKDDIVADSVGNKFFKFVSYLPSLGINPRTQKVEEAYKELRKAISDDV